MRKIKIVYVKNLRVEFELIDCEEWEILNGSLIVKLGKFKDENGKEYDGCKVFPMQLIISVEDVKYEDKSESGGAV